MAIAAEVGEEARGQSEVRMHRYRYVSVIHYMPGSKVPVLCPRASSIRSRLLLSIAAPSTRYFTQLITPLVSEVSDTRSLTQRMDPTRLVLLMTREINLALVPRLATSTRYTFSSRLLPWTNSLCPELG